jgi:benzoate-CoA ligase family protein
VTGEAGGGRAYLEIPPQLNLGEWVVDRHVREGRGGQPAVHAGDRIYSYADLRRLSNRVANALGGLGIGRGDRVLLRLGTNLDCMLAFLGAIKLGAVPIPTSLMLRAHEIGAILRNSEAVAAVVAPDALDAVEAVRADAPQLRHLLLGGEGGDPARSLRALMARASEEATPAATGPNDPAFMVYTSGTTGEPKGVEHGHRWIIGTGDPITQAMMCLGPGDVCFQPQDWSFIYALGCNFLYPFHVGAAVVLPLQRFEPADAVATIERHRVTVFCAVPTIYRMMINAPEVVRHRLTSLRMGVSAGEPLPADTFNEWRDRLGVTVHDGIGQSENHIFLANQLGRPIKPGSLGTPLPGYRLAVVDDAGAPRPPGEPGHLVIGNDHPGLALGYYRDPERWAAVNRGGWYYTKDFASVDADGYYWYVSRSDDLIKSRGYMISPKEVESALMEHAAVLEAGVVGVPDAMIGQKVCAYVTLKPGIVASPALAEDVKAHARRVIAPFKTPQEITFVPELPKTLTGKVLRRQLRAQG